MVLKIGLTGGLACGKSLAGSFFKALGVIVLDADEIAHALTAPDQPLFHSIIEHFGPSYLTSTGTLNRSLLRTRIFQDLEAKHWLESLLHPPILQELLKQALLAPPPYVILSIPLLVELGLQSFVDRVLVIDCRPELQRSRAYQRDAFSFKITDKMLAQQVSRATRLASADDILENNGTPLELKQKVQMYHKRYSGMTMS